MVANLEKNHLDRLGELIETLNTPDQIKAAMSLVTLLSDSDRLELWPVCQSTFDKVIDKISAD